ncbi:hypothetical protein D9758_010772 [Tetrapyrgos nigripes]|uniref:Uncharacterized protein n=1 Tax=Tetrapyrgos nigripes TaxID=182062 RepID=A0A8H5FZD5_9AGAR|nr:hypothetical protein D9758_010772 [Tetrapyrgos nigripes]
MSSFNLESVVEQSRTQTRHITTLVKEATRNHADLEELAKTAEEQAVYLNERYKCRRRIINELSHHVVDVLVTDFKRRVLYHLAIFTTLLVEAASIVAAHNARYAIIGYLQGDYKGIRQHSERLKKWRQDTDALLKDAQQEWSQRRNGRANIEVRDTSFNQVAGNQYNRRRDETACGWNVSGGRITNNF